MTIANPITVDVVMPSIWDQMLPDFPLPEPADLLPLPSFANVPAEQSE